MNDETEEMRVAPPHAFFDLLGIIRGYQRSRAVTAMARLSIADRLGSDRRSVSDLSVAVAADEDALYRLLRALASIGVLDEDGNRAFALTEMGQHLRSDHPFTVRPVALAFGADHQWDLWRELPTAVRTGETPAERVLGSDVWSWMASHPDENATFDDAMHVFTAGDNAAVVRAYDFARHHTVADIGGGTGGLVAAILRSHPNLRGLVFDQPGVVAGAREVLAADDVLERCDVVAGSFFDQVPAGADLYILKRILHDWPDDRALQILQSVRNAIDEDGRLLVIDAIIGDPNDGALAKFLDLMMLVGFGGRERSIDEWHRLLGAAGFELGQATPVTPNLHLIEARPANSMQPVS